MIQKKFLYILLFVGFHNIVICSSDGQSEEKWGEPDLKRAEQVASEVDVKTELVTKTSLDENAPQASSSEDDVRVATIFQKKIAFTGGDGLQCEFIFMNSKSSQPKDVMSEICSSFNSRNSTIASRGKYYGFDKPLSIVNASNSDVRVAFELLKKGHRLNFFDIKNVTLVDPRYHGLEGFNDGLRSYGFSLPWTPNRRTQDRNEGNETIIVRHENVPIVITDSSCQQDEKYSYPALKIARDLKSIGFAKVILEKKKQANTCSQNSTFQPEMSFLNDSLQKDEEIFTAKKARNGMFIIPALFVAASVMMGGK